MYNPIRLILISIVINVQTQQQSDDWYYEMGNDWEVSNKFTTSQNLYYAWYKHAAAQSATYGYATHVGKINRGQLGNPELNMNMPRDRAFGYQSDFNLEDFNSGAFTYKHPGQKFRAKAVHVHEGLASYVGEVRTMPVGRYVQEDGTILVQASYSRGDPCKPNPCTDGRVSTCTVVNKFTAKCSSINMASGEVTLSSGEVTLSSGEVTLSSGEVTLSSGEVTSPGYPGYYPYDHYGSQTISVPQGGRIELTFTAFDTESFYDELLIYDGLTDSGTILAALNGDLDNIDNPIESTSNAMTLVFTSDLAVTNTGFHATWTEFYGEVTLASGEVTSPGYPGDYPNSYIGSQTIAVPQGGRIELTFTAFDIESFYDELVIYDGLTDSGTFLAALDGDLDNIDNPIESTSNVMTLLFYSDNIVTLKGFHATWTEF